LFEGPDGGLWTSCHYFMDEKRPYPYSQSFQSWEKFPQMGIEPVVYANGRFYINPPTWTEQIVLLKK
jgi:xylan 1,4-beta-xylosidase